MNSPGYGIGYVGQALSLNGSQYVTTPFINFANSSFTVEAWIQPASLTTNGPDLAILGECDLSGASRDNCMHLILRNFNPYNIYMGKYQLLQKYGHCRVFFSLKKDFGAMT